MKEKMEEPQSSIHALPNWMQYSLVAVVLILLPISLIFDMPRAIWILLGPLFLIHLWTSQKFAYWSRESRPGLFWLALGVVVCMTVWGCWQLLTKLHGVTP